ncbi:polynucleotide adenylyltransferase PcnB [Candidatus Zixiibacteriota bacterium]
MANISSRNSQPSKGLLGRMLGLGKDPRSAEPLIVPRAEHTISRKNMEEEVLKVLYRLRNSSQMAYLVGGAVRDLLLGGKPKDYDVATDARPDQIRKLFVNSRLIGRRFRLAHIVFKGGKVVELSTFRKSPALPEEGDNGESGEERDLLIREDNTWGTPQQDAYRRDFTINALFYNIADFSVIDYVGGLADLDAGIIRTIGDPNIRFREDPVRMIRAVEYAARLDFEMVPEVLKSIRKHRKDLRKASVARISDEMLNLLKSGSAEKAFRQLHETGLLEILHADLHRALEHSEDNQLYKQLALIDEWVKKGRRVSDTVLFGTLSLTPLSQAVAAAEERKGGRLAKGEYLTLVEDMLKGTDAIFRIPVKRQHQLKEAHMGAYKMRRTPSGQRGERSMLDRGYFKDALDLFTLEVEVTGSYRNVLKEWLDLKGSASRGGRRRDSRQRREGSSRGGRGQKDSRRGKERDDARSGQPSREREDRKEQDDQKRRQREQKPVDRQKQDREPRQEKPQEPTPVQASPASIPSPAPPVEQEPEAPHIETIPPEEYEHGRLTRETRSWNGVAGQQSALIREMKKKIENGEMSTSSDDETPWFVPGQSVKENGPSSDEESARDEEKDTGEDDPDAGKWGRSRRERPPKL